MNSTFPAPYSRDDEVRPQDGVATPAARERGLRDEFLDYEALITTLWRRKLPILGGGFAAALAAGIALLQVDSTYEATASVLLDTRARQIIDIANVVDTTQFSDSAILSEVALASSDPVLREVSEALALEQYPEFNPALREPSPMTLVRRAVRNLLSGTDGPSGPGRPASHIAADIVRGKLDVRQFGSSYILEISVESESRRLAAEIANAVAQTYISNQIETKLLESRDATVWLADRAELLRSRVISSEATLERRRAELGGIAASSPEILERQRTELSVALVRARTDLTSALSRVTRFDELVEGRAYSAAAQIVDAPALQRLAERLINIQQQPAIAGSAAGGGGVTLDSARRAVETAVEAEVDAIRSGLEAVVRIARDEVEGIEEQLAALERARVDQSSDVVELRSLEREVEAQRAVYQQFLERFVEARERGEFQEADARIVSLAEPPSDSSGPRRSLLTALAFVLGSGAVAGFVVLGEIRRSGFRTAGDVRLAIGLDVIAALPPARRRAGAVDADDETRLAMSRLAITVRTASGGVLRTLMVCETLPGEGATRTCLLLAAALADLGQRVLVVDADPAGGASLKKLSGAAQGVVRPDDVAYDVAPLHAISDGGHASTTRLDRVRNAYDIVLIDCAPILAESAALSVAGCADAALLVVRWETTPQGAVQQSLVDLERVSLRVAGVVLTDVDLTTASTYEYRGASGVRRKARRRTAI